MNILLAGRYHIVKPLGSGGFGQTFLATDRHLPGKPICVVKQLHPGVTTPQALQIAQRLFNLEANVLYRLGRHDQIPQLLAHFEQGGEFYLVQEFIDGQTLAQELAQRKRLRETEVVALLRSILQVLAFVHDQGVIHRDIKPSNLIRRKPDRKIVLIDFGAVKQVNRQRTNASGETNLTVAVGSPGYMPIEQQLSQPCLASDVYAVGMVALQTLTGIAPGDLPLDRQTGEFYCALLGDRLQISPKFAAILDTMVRYHHQSRYQNAAEALAALEVLPDVQELTQAELDETVISPEAPAEELSTLFPESADWNDHSFDSQTLPPYLDSSLSDSPSEVREDSHGDIYEDIHKNIYGETHRNIYQDIREDIPRNVHEDIEDVRGDYQTARRDRATHAEHNPERIARIRLGSQEYHNRQALVSKVSNYWVKGVLETSLQDQVLLELGLEHRPDAVASPWNMAIEINHQPVKTLPPGTQIISIFDRIGAGRTLLILGEPGAGKTTTLLQLARDLLARAEQDVAHLIPVVLNLSSWAGERQSIAQWLVEELNMKYQVPKKIGQRWVEQQQLLLLLDGLDEVRSVDREVCVAVLNAFQQEYGTEMVVCSRIRDYELLSNRLNFQSAIYLRSLTPEQIHHYLDTLSNDLTGLRRLLEEEQTFQELAQSPLMLNIMVLAYQDVSAQSLPTLNPAEDRRKQLFDLYIERMLKRRGVDRQYSKAQTIRWLVWLAQRIDRESQTVFLIEQMQPQWLKNQAQQRIYQIGVMLLIFAVWGSLQIGLGTGYHFYRRPDYSLYQAVGKLAKGFLAGMGGSVVYGLIGGLTVGLAKGRIARLANGLLLGLIYGLISTWTHADSQIGLGDGLLYGVIGIFIHPFIQNRIEPADSMKWSWRKTRNNLVFGVLIVFVYILGGGSLQAALVFGFVATLISGFDKISEVDRRTLPNQGIWKSAANARTLFLTIGLLTGLLIGIIENPLLGLAQGLIVCGLAGALFGGEGSGVVCIKHLILRFILWRDGCIPWNYARFLDYAADRIFLQKVGGGYIFIHRLLMEHFARMENDVESS